MKQALIFYGGWEGHTPEAFARLFCGMLEQEGFAVTLSDRLSVLDDFDFLQKFDLFVPCWSMGKLEGRQEENICRAVAEGAGLAGCHGGMCDSFRSDAEWQFMTGAQWVAHPGNSDVTYPVHVVPDTPLTAGISDFSYHSEQYYLHYDPAVKVYASTRFPIAPGRHSPNGPVSMPVVFTKFYGQGKVFYNALGHTAQEFSACHQAMELMRRGFLWAAR